MKQKYKTYLLLTLLFLCLSELEAQFNFKVGVGSNYMLNPEQEKLINQFNIDNLSLIEQEMPDFRFITGVHLGVRNKFDRWAVELSWQYLTNRRQSYGEFPDNSLFQVELYYTIIDTYLGVEYGFNDRISYGIGFGPRILRIQREIGNSNLKINLTKESNPQWTTKFYAQYNLGGTNFTRFALRPYLDFALTDIDLNYFRDDLNISSTGDFKDPFHAVGLTLIFFNGPSS